MSRGALPDDKPLVANGPAADFITGLKAIKAEMPKDGWKLAEATNAEEAKAAHIIFDYRPEQINNQKLTKFPTIIFFKDGVEVRRIEQLISPEDIAKNYNEVGEAK